MCAAQGEFKVEAKNAAAGDPKIPKTPREAKQNKIELRCCMVVTSKPKLDQNVATSN